MIPAFQLQRQNTLLEAELSNSILKVIEKGQFILGENVQSIEKEIAKLCKVSYALGVGNGSDALELSLLACGIGPGDEVITTPFSFFATSGSISRVGAKVVFVDICPITLNIDPSLIVDKVTSRTKAIIPVHLYGCPVNMKQVIKIAKEHNLYIIEDAAQAIGAKYNGKMVGSLGDMGCFSFFPTKNLGAFGDGGMIVTSDYHMAEKIKQLRVHGSTVKYTHETLGCNSRLDELQAAVLLVKLNHLEKWTERRREIAKQYTNLLKENADEYSIKLPVEPDYAYHVYHQYTIRTKNREELQNYLKKHSIGTNVYYPIPLHLQKVYSSQNYKIGDFPIAEEASKTVISLPMFPEMTNTEVEMVVDRILSYFKR